jgi:hypothetical protein
MTDRELLELAAKASGIMLGWDAMGAYQVLLGVGGSDVRWNPLDDDGAALRLAVQLLPKITWARSLAGYEGHASATYLDEPGRRAGVIQAFNGDPFAATRRAIVRAAAAMATTTVDQRTVDIPL